MTSINLVNFNIISQRFLYITHSFYRGGRKTKLLRTSAMWPLKSERGLKEGSLIQSLFLLSKSTPETTDKSSTSPKNLLNIPCYLIKIINTKKLGLRNLFFPREVTLLVMAAEAEHHISWQTAQKSAITLMSRYILIKGVLRKWIFLLWIFFWIYMEYFSLCQIRWSIHTPWPFSEVCVNLYSIQSANNSFSHVTGQ